MNVLTLDAESFWSPTHSLSKMNPLVYIMHPETEVISLAYKFNDDRTHVIFGEDKVRQWANSVSWEDCIVVAHNGSGFDFPLLAWRFGVKPAMWLCTLAMARPIHAKTTGLSLAKLVEHYGLGVKDQKILHDTKGKHLKDFSPAEIELMRKYNAEDVDQCYGLFKKLYKVTPREELKLIDQTIRMLTEPRFEVDVPLLCETLEKEKARKAAMLQELADRLGVDDPDEVETQLASAPKFKALLEALGVDVPMKPSPTDPDKQIPALAKSDEEFLALKDHPNEVVALAANARLGVKSTLLETRITKFLETADVCGGKLPITTHYYGADTTGRRSGWLYNPLNLPRVNPDKPLLSDALRNSLKAPPGYKVVVADLSGIELRVNMFLWKVPYATELFTADPENADLYKTLASEVLGVEIEGMPKMVRQAGKAMHLGCIAEGSLVLTDHGLVPIEKVLTCMRVWDGIEWVSHEGPIYQGEQEVMTYDSLTATPDHIVYLRDGTGCRLDAAAAQKAQIARTGDGGEAVWVGADFLNGVDTARGAPLRAGEVLDVRRGEADRTAQPEARDDQGVPGVQSAENNSEVAGAEVDGDEAAVHESKRQGVQELRRARDRVSIRVGDIGRTVDHGEPRAAERPGVGQDRQQRALLAGEHSVGVGSVADGQPSHFDIEDDGVLRAESQVPGSSLRGQHAAEHAEDSDGRPDCGPMAQREVVQTKRRVWDLLNAGPRHRFTVEGRLVSNCGFGLGNPKKYIAAAKSMAQIDVTEDEAAQHIEGYREKHPEITLGWKICHAALPHVLAGTEYQIDPWGLCVTCEEGIRTPKGMIRYPALRREASGKKTEWFYGEGRHKARIYAGKIDENIVQHLARTVICDAALEIKRRTGYNPPLEVYDELVYVVPEDDAEGHLRTMLEVMRTPPKWWPELAVWAEGDVADTYGAAK